MYDFHCCFGPQRDDAVARFAKTRVNSGFERHLHKRWNGRNRRCYASILYFRNRVHQLRDTPLWTACKPLIMSNLQAYYFY